MSNAFVSKARRVRFDLTLRIIDLNNVPLVSGTSFIKWHLPSSTAAEHRGKTNKCVIREHRVEYEYEKRVAVRLTVGRDGMLQECQINFEILQEYSAGGRGERIRLGDVKLNLAEYVESGGDAMSPSSPGGGAGGGGGGELGGEEGVVRRYLMQESKINSTLKVGIHMRHTEGTRDYYAPPLRTAPVFGGIAGIMHSGEPTAPAARADGSGAANAEAANEETVPNLSSRNREMGEMQDMYRRTLAAFWTSQPGELKADEAIEDIFSGGDGWGKNGRPSTSGDQKDGNGNGRLEGGTFDANGSRPGSGTTTPVPDADRQGRMNNAGRGMMQMIGGRHASRKLRNHKGRVKGQGEVDEVEVLDDLRGWRVGETAYI